MNAKEALQLCDVSGGPVEVVLYPAGEFAETILRALRLLAAAEANDGERSQLIEELRTEADLCRNETADDVADLLDDAASSLIATGALFKALKDERNGLAARVGELEKDASVSGGVAPVSAEVKTAAGGSPAPNINEAMLLLAEVEPHLDEWNFPITLQDRVTAACNAYFGEVRPFLDAARSK